ncbi:hypothetical protein [Enterococcus cecorum]|uniref:hypothetical protein n=1 Tax=Enterococcus cecorum TaxID=44008 RepID=UPI00148DBE93|nr:hypothetical protein [Enterococcus cecorum]
MKMIEVLNMMVKGEIKEGTKLKIGYKIYDYINDYTESGDCSFVNKENDGTNLLEDNELITKSFLNYDVELIPPKPKKYLVKLNIRGLKGHFRYLNYYKTNDSDSIQINTKSCTELAKTHFTKSELKSIQLVCEFLDDMEGKYELVEVEDNEID